MHSIANEIVKLTNLKDKLLLGKGLGVVIVSLKFILSEDWRQSIKECIKEPSKTGYRKIWWQTLKYTLVGDELYRRTVDGILLKCLNEEQAQVAMGEVHEGLCGTHQSAQKMKWMLRRAGFCWSKMVEDCYRYFRGCEACQWFRDV
jgi:hypothetical protein